MQSRIRSVAEVQIRDCTADYCLRGLRVQDCGTEDTASIITGNRVYRCLESGIYLAAGSYNGSSGCINVQIVGNQVHEVFNNGILLIGGRACTVQSNNVSRSANSGIMQWHGLDNVITGNCIFDSNRLSYNGLGVDGDAFAALAIDGDDNIAAGGNYIACVQNNTIMSCNQGRHPSAVVGLQIGYSSSWGNNYPTGTNKLIKDSNCTDAATAFDNPKSVAIVVTNDYQALIDARQAQLSTAQLLICNKSLGTVASDSASNLVTSDEIKSYVDANAGGGTEFLVVDNSYDATNTWYDIPSSCRHVVWTRNGGAAGGSSGWFNLPEEPDDGFMCWLHAWGPSGADDPVVTTGEIKIKTEESGSTFRSSTFDDPDITSTSSTEIKIKKPQRKSYLIRYESENQYWYVKHTSSRISNNDIAQIGNNTRYFKHFANDESGYQHTGSNIFPVPSGYHEALVLYGDGTNFGSNSGGSGESLGVNFELPVTNLLDGQKVVLHSTMHRQSTDITECLRLNFPGNITGTPNTRRVCALGVEYLANASGGTRIVIPSSNNHTKNSTFVYCQTADVWILRVDQN